MQLYKTRTPFGQAIGTLSSSHLAIGFILAGRGEAGVCLLALKRLAQDEGAAGFTGSGSSASCFSSAAGSSPQAQTSGVEGSSPPQTVTVAVVVAGIGSSDFFSSSSAFFCQYR